MAKITFSKNDVFSFGEGVKEYGVVLSNDKALLFKGQGGRTGRTVLKSDIPEDAMPVADVEELPYQIQFAIKAVSAVI